MKLFDDYIDRSDKEPGGYSESNFSYLNRSGRAVVENIRNFLELWFSRFPETSKLELRGRFRSKDDTQHNSAFFELYVHELLFLHGYRVEAHPESENQSNKRPDFIASRNGIEPVYVEAVLATDFSRKETSAEARLNRAYDALNKVDSPNFFVGLNVYGSPSTPVPEKQLRSRVESFLRSLNPDVILRMIKTSSLSAAPHGRFSHAGCTFEFYPIPKAPEARGKPGLRTLGMHGAGEVEWIDDKTALRKAILIKAKRYGSLGRPFIIAINAMSQYLADIDIGEVLFGEESYFVTRNLDKISEVDTRRLNGTWIRSSGPINTRVSAVLIVSSVSPWSVHVRVPVIFHNPWAKHPCVYFLPNLTQSVPVNNQMEVRDGKQPDILFGLRKELLDG